MRLRALAILILGLSLFVSCLERQDGAAPEAFMKTAPVELASMEPAGRGVSQNDFATLPSVLLHRKLIRNASLDIEVEIVDEAVREATFVAERNGGVLADSQFFRNAEGKQRCSIRLRIPSERFDAVLTELHPLGTVRSASTDTQDVTKAYADLEIRLAVKRDTAERLRDILDHRTGKLSEVLEVERELARVIGEIESMEGEKRYYDQQVAVSTIAVELTEPGAGEPGPFAAIGDAFASALGVLADSVAILVFAVTFLAPWLLVASIAFWVFVTVRRRLAA
ncbi:MAG: DUF4349 domain-containing protein [Acidobacteriota bacterium]|nr:DUF4349 domain-containing protein [Acidobacteriota bacterium]